MMADWPRMGKLIIGAIPAFLVLLAVLLVLIDWPWRNEAITQGTWMVIAGVVLSVLETVIIYYLKQ